jgi:hypothetical protein
MLAAHSSLVKLVELSSPDRHKLTAGEKEKRKLSTPVRRRSASQTKATDSNIGFVLYHSPNQISNSCKRN